MSRYHGNDERCPHCRVTYGAFRTGFTYDAIKQMLWDWSDDRADWKYKRRGTVLGIWHQTKREMWARHKEEECVEIPPMAVGAALF